PCAHAAARRPGRLSAMTIRATYRESRRSSPIAVPTSAARALIGEAAAAQRRWAATPLKRRLSVLRRFRQLLAADALCVAAKIERRHVGDTVSSEVWPLLEASRYLERHARRVLAVRRPAPRGWPLPGRSRVTVAREPYGVV